MSDGSTKDEYLKIEKKLLLLYLLDKMEIPLTNMQITEFALEQEFMDYFEVQESLSEMVTVGYLDKTEDSYTLTDEGLEPLKFFTGRIPLPTRNQINHYVLSNRNKIKKDFEVTANYFYDHVNNEFTVKCGAYEERSMLMEINVTVTTKEHARNICGNWKNNVNELYGNILEALAATPTAE